MDWTLCTLCRSGKTGAARVSSHDYLSPAMNAYDNVLAVWATCCPNDLAAVACRTMPFQPGQSGNLKGRPRGQTVSAELRRQADPEKIAARLLAIIDNPKASSRDVLAAAQLVLDRMEGKALSRGVSVSARVQPADLVDAGMLDGLSTDQQIDEIIGTAAGKGRALPEGEVEEAELVEDGREDVE